jgi:hypothetical protein
MSDAITIHDPCPGCGDKSLKPHCANVAACDCLGCSKCRWIGTRDGKRASKRKTVSE